MIRFPMLRLSFCVLMLAASAFAAAPLDVSPVWAGHPVAFDLLTQGDRQFVAFYDADRNLTVAARTIPAREWQFVRLPTKLAWDSHNSITMTLDRDGYLHLAANMHAVPLVYFRTAKPFDIATFERLPMVGRDEQRCTYPHWIKGPSGELLFTYRDGRSGSGNQIYNVYDTQTRAWKRLLETPLTDGQGRMNAYFAGPITGPDGFYHLVWTWRDTPDCSTNHDLSYARSRDLIHWETSAGKPLQLPIRVETAEIVDAVPIHGGLINGNTRLGWDSQKRVVVTYHKYDAHGNLQIMCARREADGWHKYQVTDWDYRWDFQGGGTIVFEITHGAVRPAAGGKLLLDYKHVKFGSGTWELDESTLRPVGTVKQERQWPAELDRVESDFPGMAPHFLRSGRWLLRWETLGANRDRPRQPPLPAPSMLRLYDLQAR